MQLKTKFATGIAVFCLSITVQAGDIVELRGYDNCVEQIEQELAKQRPKVSPVFFMTRTAEALNYYINAAAWVDGNRQSMRSECVTSTSGHNVLSINVEPGQFKGAPKGKVEIEVAATD